jgi:ankyrin repeat protein
MSSNASRIVVRSCSILILAALAAAPALTAQSLFDAVRDDDVGAVAKLLESDPALVRATDDDDRTALHHAATYGLVDVALILVDAGSDVDAREQDGETPLHYAAWRSELEVAGLLIESGADLEIRNDWGRTPLLIVARETGSAPMARLLIDVGAEVNLRDEGGESPLDLAAWRGFRDLVNLLLDEGAELPPPESVQGRYLAMFAAEKGLDRLFGLLADAGVDLGLRNENDGSLLHSASQGGSAEVVARLLGEGFDPNERDRYGRAPLHYASEMGHQDIARLLLDHEAQIDARSLSGETALNTAEWVERPEMADFLAAAGGSTEARRFPALAGPYLAPDPPPPGAEPRLFAPDIVSTHRFQHGTIAFAPDMDEAYWSSQIALQETGYSRGLILYSRLADGRWTEPSPAPFSRLGLGDDVPIFAPDGDRLYFLSGRPVRGEEGGGGERIWYVTRSAIDSTGWSEPEIVVDGPNTLDLHWEFSVAADRSLYVPSRGDLYVSRLEGGSYQGPESLGAPINSDADEAMPFISPDGSYLLFTRFGHPDNHGFADLWISFKDEAGGWKEPLNLGERINSVAGICPIVSPDGAYLFFNAAGDNYWVDAGVIEESRAAAAAR